MDLGLLLTVTDHRMGCATPGFWQEEFSSEDVKEAWKLLKLCSVMDHCAKYAREMDATEESSLRIA